MTTFTTVRIIRVDTRIEDGARKTTGGRILVTLDTILPGRNMIDLLGNRTGGHKISVVAGRTVICHTGVVKITIGKINKRTGHMTHRTVLIGWCGRDMIDALTGTEHTVMTGLAVIRHRNIGME